MYAFSSVPQLQLHHLSNYLKGGYEFLSDELCFFNSIMVYLRIFKSVTLLYVCEQLALTVLGSKGSSAFTLLPTLCNPSPEKVM